MKRRNFLKISSTIGAANFISSGCSHFKASGNNGFDLHPIIKKNPDAVFIHKTAIKSKGDTAGLQQVGLDLSKELIVDTNGFSKNTKTLIKPNWTNLGFFKDRNKDFDILGVHTDFNFLDGFMRGLISEGLNKQYIRDCAIPSTWNSLGYLDFAEKNAYDLKNLSSKPVWEYAEADINFVQVKNGKIFKNIALMAPAGDPNVFLINIAKFKSHGMGITGAVKNIQGLCAHSFHSFCMPYDRIRKSYDKKYMSSFHENFEKNIETDYQKHVEQGISRWARPGSDGGIWMETWVQRMLDAYSVIKPDLNIIEGIYGHEGDGLGRGPQGKGKDHLSNFVLFGLDPIRLDIIAHWLAGHEPGNFGLFHVAIERGLSNVLDPREIPLYQWGNGVVENIQLDDLKRTPLLTYYLARDYGRGREPKYHMVDEEFDYLEWKKHHSSFLSNVRNESI